jgi:hypothetical protein
VPDFVEAQGRVLHGVVEDARHNHVLRAAGFEENLRHGKRVDDVGDFRSLPALPAMGAGREFDGIEDGSHVQPRSMRYYFPGNRFLYTSKGSRGRDENPAGVKK